MDASYSSSDLFLKIDLSTKPSSRQTRQRLRLRRELGWTKDRASIGSQTSWEIEYSVIHSLKPWRVFKEGSSDILDIAWSSSGDTFAVASATLSDVYNRPGNLVLGSIPLSKVKMLHGHQQPRPEPLGGQDPILHSTVPGVGFSPSGILFSGGYDGTVKLWHPDMGVLLSTRQMDDRVECLSVSPHHHNLVAVGCKTGTLELLSWDNDGTLLSADQCVLNKTITDILYPSCLAWGGRFYNQYLIAGYDTQSAKSNAGSLVIYDVLSGSQFMRVTPGSTRQFDIAYHPNGSFATACAARSAKSGVKSHIRMFHFTNTGAGIEFDVDTHQLDINRVTIS